MANDSLRSILDGFESRTTDFDASEVFGAIATYAKTIDAPPVSDDLRAEMLAFGCVEHRDRCTDHQFNLLDADISQGVIDYWERRGRESAQPFLKWRYSALAVEARQATKLRANSAEMQQIVIDSAIEMARLRPDFRMVARLACAHSLAVKFGNREGISKLRGSILQLENGIAVDHLPGTWGFAFDILMSEQRSGIDSDEEQRVIADLEARFSRLLTSVAVLTDVHILTAAAVRLAAYYQRTNQPELLSDVVGRYADRMLSLCSDADPYLVIGQLSALANFCGKYGQRHLDAKIMLAKAAHQRRLYRMPTTTTSITVTDDELQEHLDGLMSDGLEVGLQRIAWSYVPNVKQINEQVAHQQSEAPLSSMLPITKLDHTGRDVAGIGSTLGDPSGRAMLWIEEGLIVRSLWLHLVLGKLRDQHPNLAGTIVDVIHLSSLFAPSQREIIEKGIGAYFAGEHLVAIHLLTPQIEAAIRNCASQIGVPTMRVKRDRSSTSLRLLDDLLRDKAIIQSITEDATFYFRVLLSDPRGWNVRHKVCHGFAPVGFLDWRVSTLIVHTLLVLAHIREASADQVNDAPTDHDT